MPLAGAGRRPPRAAFLLLRASGCRACSSWNAAACSATRLVVLVLASGLLLVGSLSVRLVQHVAQLGDQRPELVGDRLVAVGSRPPSAPCRTPCARPRSCCARRLNRCVSMTMPSTPDGTSSESFFTSSPARPKIACSSFSSGVSSLFDLGETLPTRMSPGLTKVPMRTMPFSSRLRQRLGRDVGDVAGELLLAQLRLADLDLELLDVDRGVGVVLHQLSR